MPFKKTYSSLDKKLARNTLWMLVSKFIIIFVQGSFFIILARALGPTEYGAFVGVSAFVGIFLPFSGLGSSKILIKNASRNELLFSEYWGNSIFTTITSGLLLAIVAVGLYAAIFPNDFLTACIIIAIADLVFYKLYRVSSDALVSVELMRWVAKIDVVFRITSLMAALCLSVFVDDPSIFAWSFLYLAVRLLTLIWSFLLVAKIMGPPKLSLSRIGPEMLESFYFAVSASSATIYNDIDKSMLSRLSTLDATGIYGAAYRIVTVAFTPVLSLLGSAYARFFKAGRGGIVNTLAFAKKLIPISALYGIAASVGLIVFAPVVPYILGDEYSASVGALRWLAPLIFLKSMHYFAADTLTGAGFQGLRTLVQVGIAIFNFLANIWLIPLYSWRGAIWSSLASDGLLVIILWLLVFKTLKNKPYND